MTAARVVPLVLVLALAAGLRLVALDDAPRGFYFDESAVALNARCLVESGRDQYAEPWPFFFRALDDYKDPVFVYGVAAWSLVAGDDVRAARTFAALCGVLSIFGAWLLAREVLPGARAPLVVTGLLAVSPWHLQFSRIAWQAITLVLVQTFAAWLLLRAARLGRAPAATPPLVAGSALLGLVLWTYSPAKLWVPLLAGAFVACAVARARRWPWTARATVAGLSAFALAATPFALAYARHFDEVNLRFTSLSVLANGGGPLDVARGWAAHLSPGFLFGEGDPNLRHSPPGVGQLLLPEAPLLLLGLVALWRDRTTGGRLVVAWVLLAPLLGAFTVDPPHATRVIALLPALQVAVARGALACVRAAGPRRGLATLTLTATLGAAAGHATWAHFTAPSRTPPDVWRPDVSKIVDRSRALAREVGAPKVHFLPGTRVTYVDWLYLTRAPAALLHAHADRAREGRDRYDPFDRAGRFEFAGAAFPGREVGPGALVVQGPGDAAPPGALLAREGDVSYWRLGGAR